MPTGEKQYVVMEQQIEDLRDRMRLLQQDRRANVDLLESNKSSNVEEVRFLREENKDLRIRLSQLQRANDSSRGENQELAHAQREVLRMRAEYDSLKSLSTKHKNQLDKLKDEVKTCHLESRRPNQEDNPMTRQIRMLENRLDKAMIKYNEAQSIKTTYEQVRWNLGTRMPTTSSEAKSFAEFGIVEKSARGFLCYERRCLFSSFFSSSSSSSSSSYTLQQHFLLQIVKRLKEERVGFDNQLQALERTLQAKQRDYEELLFLSGDANHAREVSQQVSY